MEVIDGVKDILCGDLEPEFPTDRLQQIAERHIGMENVDGFELRLIDTFQIRAQDGRLPQAHFTDECYEPLTFFDAIDQRPQRRLMAGAQEEEFWIWGDVKGRFFQRVKIEIHRWTLPARVILGFQCLCVKIIPHSWRNESQPYHTA